MSPAASRSVTYVPVPTREEAQRVAEQIAQEHGARLVTGWSAAAAALDHDDQGGAELASIVWEARRASLVGTTAARALVAVREIDVASGARPPDPDADSDGDSSPAPSLGRTAEDLWTTLDRLWRLEDRVTDVTRIFRGMVIALVGTMLVLSGTDTTSTPVSLAVGVVGFALAAGWTIRARRRARESSRLLSQQLAALGPDPSSRLRCLTAWADAWDAIFAESGPSREEQVVLATLLQLEAAGIGGANDLEVARGRWDEAVAERGLDGPVPLHAAHSVVASPDQAEPVVVMASTVRGVDAGRVRQLLQRPALGRVWVVAPGVDAWASGVPS